MKALGGFDKCTLCLSQDKLTYEHIIPESIGGFLEVDLQCAKCNNERVGSKLVPKAKRILPIRLAIRSLKHKLPSLYNTIEEGQEYTAKSSDDSIQTAFLKKGEIISKARKDENGVVSIDRKDTDKNLRGILKKEGLSASEIEKKINSLKDHKIDAPLKLSNALTVVKRKFISLFPKTEDVDMDDRIITLIAYNYLCITTGEMIFSESFDVVRKFILEGTKTEDLFFEQFPYNGPYKPYHKIYRETLEDRTNVTIVLFGSIAYIISFLNIKVMSDNNYILIQDLEDKKLYFSATIEEAKKGIYYVG
jgi:hypothetical protein